MFTILFRVRFCIIYNLAKKSIIGCKKYIIRYLLHIVHIFIMSEDKAKLKALVAERGYIKGTLSRLNNFCHDADAMAATSREALREKRLRMSEAFQEYMQLNKAILVLADEDAENYGEYEDKYYESVGLLDKACSGPQTEAKPNGGENSNPGTFKNLPKINLPNFNGEKVVEYYPFINMFRSVIHTDKKLSSCEKLYYLRSYLSGEALELIRNLPLTDDNYVTAVKLLEKRYDNTPKIINYHVDSLLDLPAFTKCTAHNLRSLISTVNVNMEALKNLKQPVEHWDILLINILAKKIDIYTYRGFHLERNAREVPTLSEFLDYLEKRALALENTSEEKQPSFTAKSTRAPKVSGVAAAEKPQPACLAA
ncbi:uncharacterized protein LOC126370203 isoform X2 [Pectinophora gossypiella]|uniref:uncharacterized protein LOC126370203 isoform X2 n=2 Tax=Pectinophora gossypiella TaxID=13191 RepID=UPI00214E2C0B|nr:uncharacterized protein LOC126370203 isoform X2 [Pectinophora gossypiella]